MVHKLGIDPAQNLEVGLRVCPNYHPVRPAQAVYRITLGQELRVRGHAEILHAMLGHDLLQQPGGANGHGALVHQYHAVLLLALGQQIGQPMGGVHVHAQVGGAIPFGRRGQAEEDEVGAFYHLRRSVVKKR